MALFGKKKRSIDDLLEDIAALSEEEKNSLVSMLTKQETEQEEVKEPIEEPSEEVEVEQEETVEEEPSEGALESDPVEQEPVAEQEEVVGEVEEVEETPAMEVEEAMDNAPTETPEPIRDETHATNYDDVIAAQAARIDSLEALVAELKQTVETVVSNQDNKNFGVSPNADFNDDEQNLRRDAILQSYAPRRYDQYK